MLRRLFFVVPHPALAVELVGEIEHMGVKRDHIHALARTGMDLSTLPKISDTHDSDIVWRIEWNLWKVNLTIFGLASLIFIAALMGGYTTWAAVMLAVMVLTCVIGALFVLFVPDTVNEFTAALAHGEIVLMVDVPKRRVRDIETWVDRHHPEAICGGVGWTTEHFKF